MPGPVAGLSAFEPDEAWVPADRRWLGLDRRTIAPTLLVFILTFFLATVLPAINDAVSYDDTVVAGDIIEVAGGITFVPEPGWGITSGVRRGDAPKAGQYPPTATVADGDVTLTVRSATFDGDANALLGQIKTTTDAMRSKGGIHIAGEPTSITTNSGERGLITSIGSPQAAGLIAVFVLDGQGIAAVTTGPTETGQLPDDAVMRMITSIRSEGQPK